MRPKLNKSMAMALKKLLHKNRPTIFMALRKDESGKSIPREYSGSLKRNWPMLSKLNQQGSNIFMLINNVLGDKRTSEQVTDVNAVFIDYDRGDWSAEDINSFLKKFPVQPHIVVATSPGCFHVYWLVFDVPLDKFNEVQQHLAAQFGADPKVCDLPRMMRMPGTINWKHETPFLSEIIYTTESTTPIPYHHFSRKMFGGEPSTKPSAGKHPVAIVASPRPGENDDLVQQVTQALQRIPANDRKIWVTVGMALKNAFGDSGLQIFKDWSSKSSKYNEQELERQWRSFNHSGGITIRTVFYLAKSCSNALDVTDENAASLTNSLMLAGHFAKASTNVLKHCEEEKSWYVLANGRWGRSNRLAERVAINYLQAMRKAAAQSKNDDLRSFIERQQSHNCARELLRAAESDPVLSVRTDAYDQAANVLAVKLPEVPGAIERYKVLSLVRKKARFAKPDDMVLRVAGAAYDATAECPYWMKFIEQITEGDSDLADFLQLATGYTLYGHTNEQVIFILIGIGGNGKGVFSRILYKLLGDYSAIMQSNLLKPGAINANNPSPALMKLRSKRYWLCSEVPKGMVLDEALIKQITGGDIVSARGLYSDQVEFLPIGKLWLSVNYMPRVRHDDEGMWRRIVAIPFKAVFKGQSRDNDLEDKLQRELPGILNWALDGARKYASKEKLGRPRASRELLASLRRDVDTVGLWIKSRCVVTDDGKLQSKLAYDDYCETMKREKAVHLPQKEFKADLVQRGHLHKTGRDYNYFVGLDIKAS